MGTVTVRVTVQIVRRNGRELRRPSVMAGVVTLVARVGRRPSWSSPKLVVGPCYPAGCHKRSRHDTRTRGGPQAPDETRPGYDQTRTSHVVSVNKAPRVESDRSDHPTWPQPASA